MTRPGQRLAVGASRRWQLLPRKSPGQSLGTGQAAAFQGSGAGDGRRGGGDTEPEARPGARGREDVQVSGGGRLAGRPRTELDRRGAQRRAATATATAAATKNLARGEMER